MLRTQPTLAGDAHLAYLSLSLLPKLLNCCAPRFVRCPYGHSVEEPSALRARCVLVASGWSSPHLVNNNTYHNVGHVLCTCFLKHLSSIRHSSDWICHEVNAQRLARAYYLPLDVFSLRQPRLPKVFKLLCLVPVTNIHGYWRSIPMSMYDC